ncbi:DNA cytosine methyltransferase [Tenacibaculum maritimum]|uniref:DNA (cytosine-5-)-methyltransferase n=1 Tax=Tenacibaculum maritimum NCIMB 2154 TaxID=1349785 RepID=A0A2H1E9F1_9FLAO|nr:DNA cytosine methyltransferase [Tenacibaculum maritimum]SFZ82445.1 cytosine-specific methyltransferase [Tenacibaculum maritimum NCIMB 2154]
MKLKNKIKAVDFFCGGGGMSYGMQKSGIQVLAGIDYEENCRATYEANIKKAKFIKADVFELKETDLEKALKLKRNDDELLLIGCSPCQFWSIINTDKKKSQKSKNLLVEFERFVKYFNPGYVVVENVPGVLRKKGESGLETFINWLEENKYTVHFKVHNTSEYGVPQNRKRFTLIANRISNNELEPVKVNKKLTVRDVIGVDNGYPQIKAGHRDKTDFNHSVPNVSELTLRRLKKVKKDGGNRLSFANDPELQLDCFIGRDNSFKDTFGRLWWDKPSPTITTKFFSVSNGRFVHPEENRALSIREGATLQSFPKDYKFIGTSIGSIARLIGNAVPPEYAKRVGQAIIQNHKNAI